MFDPYATFADAKSLRIPLGKGLTNLPFENILKEYLVLSTTQKSVDFDFIKVEWISLFELLLLIQWIHLLTQHDVLVRVFLPYSSAMPGSDETDTGLQRERTQLSPMYRRQKVSSFLKRINFHQEIRRLTGSFPIDIGASLIADADQTEAGFTLDEEQSDPFSAKILHLKAFWSEEALSVEGDLSNQELRTMLEEHSCLDPIDSGMLAEVLINELVSNAIHHGIRPEQSVGSTAFSCAWVAARLVKSSRRSIEEAPTWLAPVYRSLLGRHYVEVSICDTGMGIYRALKDHIPRNMLSDGLTVKAILDYAFDKFSSSKTNLRTEEDVLPRGLFSVYDLVRQYGGVLVLRSSGYYMAYDFLNGNRNPRLIDLYDKTGACQDIANSNMNQGGTAIQIILPESKGLFVKTLPQFYLHEGIEFPEHLLVVPPNGQNGDLKGFSKKIAGQLEKLCRNNEKKPIFVDLTRFDVFDANHLYVLARIVRYVLYLGNPNILWLVGPRECDILPLINQYLHTGCFPDEDCLLFKGNLKAAFENVKPFDRRVCPMLLPSGKVLWLGASETETLFLRTLWGAEEIDIEDSGFDLAQIMNLLRANRHLVSCKKERYGGEKISLRVGLYECTSYLPKIIDRYITNQIRETKGVLHESGSYHLPHGEYSNVYIHFKPLLSQTNIARQMARYMLIKLSLTDGPKEIDIVVGGTHSAKRLIAAVADELNAEPLIIDRYTEQIEDPDITNVIRGKRALIVSDVISTGSFVDSIKRKFSLSGCKVEAICCICDIRVSPVIDREVPVISLHEYPIDKFDIPSKPPVYEINPISLVPMLYSKEEGRMVVPSLIGPERFINLLKESEAFIPGHIVLGPTHYTYFVDTKVLLDRYAAELFKFITEDLEKEIESRDLNLDDICLLLTAEDSNAERALPTLVKSKLPNVLWAQLDRIRLTKEGTWQLDNLDEASVKLENVKQRVFLVLDDGSNTGGTIMQMIKAAAELAPRTILGYCIVNRLHPIRASFLSELKGVGNCRDVSLKFIANFPIATFIRSNCPICNAPTYKVPPDLEEYVLKQKEVANEYSWNHISAARIRTSVSSPSRDKGNSLSEGVSSIYSRSEDKIRGI